MELKRSRVAASDVFLHLLIVPYGIETFYPHRINNYCILLIVPYGIETELPVRRWLGIRSFNRTLWN